MCQIALDLGFDDDYGGAQQIYHREGGTQKIQGKSVIYQQDLGILNPRIEDP